MNKTVGAIIAFLMIISATGGIYFSYVYVDAHRGVDSNIGHTTIMPRLHTSYFILVTGYSGEEYELIVPFLTLKGMEFEQYSKVLGSGINISVDSVEYEFVPVESRGQPAYGLRIIASRPFMISYTINDTHPGEFTMSSGGENYHFYYNSSVDSDINVMIRGTRDHYSFWWDQISLDSVGWQEHRIQFQDIEKSFG